MKIIKGKKEKKEKIRKIKGKLKKMIQNPTKLVKNECVMAMLRGLN